MKNLKWMIIATITLSLGGLTACEKPAEDDAEATAPSEERAALEEAQAEAAEAEADLAAEGAAAAQDDAPAAPVVGEPAPDFTLVDETGTSHTLSQYKGKTVVLEWFNIPCPYVNRHYDA